MATTSPDNIRTPNPTDPYNLVSDLAITANDVQAALVKRANSYVGTSAQRTAFTNAPDGSTWQDTNSPRREYIRTAGTWRGKSPLHGNVSFTGAAGSHTKTVTFPSGYFATTPTIQLTATSGTSTASTVAINAQSASPTGFTVRIDRGAAMTNFGVAWSAFPA